MSGVCALYDYKYYLSSILLGITKNSLQIKKMILREQKSSIKLKEIKNRKYRVKQKACHKFRKGSYVKAQSTRHGRGKGTEQAG